MTSDEAAHCRRSWLQLDAVRLRTMTSITQRFQLLWWWVWGTKLRLHMWQGRRVSVRETTREKSEWEEESNSPANHPRHESWWGGKQINEGWEGDYIHRAQQRTAGLSCFGILPHAAASSSHTGGLVSPTDSPTINAMTASRINRANAMMMYFCQVKER